VSDDRSTAGAIARWLIAAAGALVPRGQRARWHREWEAELWHRERRLRAEGAGHGRSVVRLVGPALGAFVHAGWLFLRNPGLEGLARDVRFAMRSYRRAPGFTAAAVLTLGLGIAASVVVLAVLQGALLRPYRYEDAERLAALVNRDAARPGTDLPWSIPDLRELRDSGPLESVIGVDWDPFNLRLEDRTEWVGGGLVSGPLFRTLGLRPILGRDFGEQEEREGARVVVLGERLWREAFGGGDVLGETAWLDAEPYEVIGVAPAAADIPDGADLWVPLRPAGEQETRQAHWLQAWGRLAPGRTWEEARSALDVLAERLAREVPETNEGRGFEAIPLREYRTGGLRLGLGALAGSVTLLLLIVCANLAGLLLARASARADELAIRRALGAGPGRLVRQLLTECLVLAGFGGLLGLALGGRVVRSLVALIPNRPAWFVPSLDGPVIPITLAVTLACALLFGLGPVLAGTTPHASGRGGRRMTARSRGALVFAEVALSTVLLVAAGLLVRSLTALTSVDPGFDPDARIAGTVQLPVARYATDASVAGFATRVIETLESRADVESAAAVTRLPFRSGTNQVMWWEDRQGDDAYRDNPQAELNSVTPGYLDVMGIPLLRGRGLDRADDADAEAVVLIGETFAREFFRDRDPIGARISFSARPRFFRVVGVVGDTKHRDLAQDARFQLYAAFDQRPTTRLSFVVKTRGDVGPVGRALRDAVRALDPDLALSELIPVEDAVADSVWRLRLLTRVFWGFGVFALVLAAVGIAGVVSQAVSRRTREIGIRQALGADRRQVLSLVGLGAGRIVALGLAAGVGVSLALARLAEGALYGVEPRDPLVFVVVVAGFGVVGVVAAWVPARRATSIDPAAALRID